MIADSHHIYHFGDWYVFLGFAWTSLIFIGLYIKYLESKEEENDS